MIVDKPVGEMTEGEFRLFVVWRLEGVEKRLDGIIKAAWGVALALLVAGVGFILNVLTGAVVA